MNKLLTLYGDEWRFFRESLTRTFFLLFGLFIVAMSISLFFFRQDPALALKAVHGLFSRYEERHGLLQIQSLRFFFIIVKNNLLVSFISLLLGLIPFLLLPTLSTLRTGYILAALIHSAGGGSILTLFAGILPHGIIEIPACIYAACLGVQLSWGGTKNRGRMMTVDSVRKEAANSVEFSRVLKSYALIVIPSLVLAALVETYLTPLIISMTMR
ncbi:MAG TPA: stage II sporulation protein M [Candidatus Aminicenantes bacterium]|nr:stage II sporulation protein M [Candidatus Aminicenantes bacterium]